MHSCPGTARCFRRSSWCCRPLDFLARDSRTSPASRGQLPDAGSRSIALRRYHGRISSSLGFDDTRALAALAVCAARGRNSVGSTGLRRHHGQCGPFWSGPFARSLSDDWSHSPRNRALHRCSQHVIWPDCGLVILAFWARSRDRCSRHSPFAHAGIRGLKPHPYGGRQSSARARDSLSATQQTERVLACPSHSAFQQHTTHGENKRGPRRFHLGPQFFRFSLSIALNARATVLPQPISIAHKPPVAVI